MALPAPGFQIRADIFSSYEWFVLSRKRGFMKKFLAAARGEKNELSEFVKPWHGRPTRPQWDEIRARIFARDNYTCKYCGDRGGKLECDHIEPVSLGGSNEDENLTTACFRCNRSKRNKTLSEWGGASV